jgi:hypothetical protein
MPTLASAQLAISFPFSILTVYWCVLITTGTVSILSWRKFGKRMKAVLGTILVLLMGIPMGLFFTVFVYVLLNPPTPPLPSLLKGATAHGGYFGACPPANATEAVAMHGDSAASPELTQRLAQEFPVGSSASRLSDALSEQGFRLSPSCPSDPSIHIARFDQTGGSMFAFPMIAVIFWKGDERDAIVWAKGFVAFTGP